MNKETLIKTVLSAQNGDNKAIELLFKEFNQQVYYSILLTVKNEELAKDITQETFITVIRKIGELENPEAFPSWIKKVAHSKCSDYYKKKEVLHETTVSTDGEDDFDIFGNIEEEDIEFIPHQALDKDDLKQIILDILNELPDVQRAAIFMRYYENLSVKEIAEIQGVSEGTVMSRLNYGRKAIKKAIEDYEKENDIKLHAFPFLPFFHWIFEATKNQAAPKIIGNIATGVTKATGVSISVSSATSGAAVASATTSGAVAGSAVPGSAVAGSAVAGSTVAGSTVAGSTVAGSAVAGSAVAGSTVAGSAVASATTGMGLAAKIAAIPLVAKIAVPVVVATTIITPVAVKNTKTPETNEPTESTTLVEVVEVVPSQETTTELTTEEASTEANTIAEVFVEKNTTEVVTTEAPEATVPESTAKGTAPEPTIVEEATTKEFIPQTTKPATTQKPQTTTPIPVATTKKAEKEEKTTLPEEAEEENEDVFEIYEDGEELVEEEEGPEQSIEDSPELEIDGTTAPR